MGWKKKARLHAVAFVVVFLFICILPSYSQTVAEEIPIDTVKVEANEEVLELVKAWGEKICIFTSKKRPLKSLNRLTYKQISLGVGNGQETLKFCAAAKIENKKGIAIFNSMDSQIFSKMDAPRLLITICSYAEGKEMLKDATRVLFVPFAEKANSDYLKKVQTILKDKGYDPGPIDGKWGKKTELALRKYQMDIGLKVTGKLGQETQKSLGLK